MASEWERGERKKREDEKLTESRERIEGENEKPTTERACDRAHVRACERTWE